MPSFKLIALFGVIVLVLRIILQIFTSIMSKSHILLVSHISEPYYTIALVTDKHSFINYIDAS